MYADMSPEQITAEKLRLKQLQEEADLKTALDTLGLTSSSSATLDCFNPTTTEEFQQFSDSLSKQILQFKAKEEFVPFLDEFVRTLCAGCEFIDITSRRQPVNFNRMSCLYSVII